MTKQKGRKPVHMEMVGGKGSRQRVWEAIRKHAGTFTLYQISRKANADDETVYTYLLSLQRGGFLEGTLPAGSKPGKAEKKWKLIRDNGVEAPRLKRDGSPVTQGLGTEAMWRSMRIIGSFNGRELAAHASACGVEVKETTAKAYIIVLHAAGYLKVVEAAKLASPGKPPAQARYVLAPGKYTGPRPPMIQRTKTLYDPNLAKVVWNEEIDHDDL